MKMVNLFYEIARRNSQNNCKNFQTWLSVLIASSWSIVASTAPEFARSTASITSRSISGNIVLKSDIACANSNCNVDAIVSRYSLLSFARFCFPFFSTCFFFFFCSPFLIYQWKIYWLVFNAQHTKKKPLRLDVQINK